MASLVLGAVGGYFFGPVGWMIGSAVGSLLFPEKQEGPKLSDLRLQGSSYGQMIPIPYGTVRMAPQLIWQTDLIPHKHSSGGKGGPQVTTYSYSASFAVKVCKGPVVGVLRIWADSTLIYDTTGASSANNSLVPVTIYLGDDESAPADPTMETALGVGNVPAFRDDCVLVFTDMDLTNYGNRLPSFSVEVFTGQGTIPYRVNTFTVPHSSVRSTAEISGASIDNLGAVDVGIYDCPNGSGTTTYTLDRYDFVIGAHIDQPVNITFPNFQGVDGIWYQATNDSGMGYFRCAHLGNTGDVSTWALDGALASAPVMANVFAVASNYYLTLDGTAIYVTGGGGGGDGYVGRFQVNARVPQLTTDAGFTFAGTNGGTNMKCVVDDTTGKVYVGISSSNGPTYSTTLNQFDADLNLLHTWATVDLPSEMAGPGTYNFIVWNGLLCFGGVDPTTTDNSAIVYHINGDFTFTRIGSTPVAVGNFLSLRNGFVLTPDGVISLNPPPSAVTLASIVQDQSERAGLTSGQLDVSALTDLVDGYIVSRQSDARSNIIPLQAAYFFDGVESAGQMKFVKRGGPVSIVIPDNDLCAQVPGAQAPPLLTYKRVDDVALPALVNVSYLDIDVAMQEGTQQARRQVGQSQAVSEIQLPIVMNAQKARNAANVNCFGAWLERDTFTALLPRKYEYLEPTDVVSIRGYTLRAIRKSDVAVGITQLELVQTNAELYLAAPASSPTSGGQQTTPAGSVATEMLMLDIPLIDDADNATNPNGAYAAMAGATGGNWVAAALYKSADGGATYDQIAVDNQANSIGASTTALGGFAGGNMFDEVNTVTIALHPGAGDLASSNELGVLNGANMAVLGSEVLQFRDATLIATDTYTLGGFLRGRRGTEWAINGHVSGEEFVLLPASVQVNNPFSELEQARLYKAVSAGGTLAAATAVPFTNTGIALRCYSPTGVGGGLNASGDLTITWQRRTRVGGAWANFVDVPLSESIEQYIVQIWDATFVNCARIIGPVTTPTAGYTAAEQVIDFGATQKTIYITVGQIGALGLGVQTGAALLGAGSTIDPVIAPITPYGSAPPSGPPLGSCVGPVYNTTLTFAVGDAIVSSPAGFVGPGSNWVLKLTTPSSGNYLGYLVFYEDGSPPGVKHLSVSTSACGAPLIPAAALSEQEPALNFFVGAPYFPTMFANLAPSTDYYFSLQTDSPGTTAIKLHIQAY